jgi:hypothetical protein
MSAILLCPPAEDCILRMGLSSEDGQIARNCVLKYSRPNDFCEALVWLVNRVINAICHMWGSSDWDIAIGKIQQSAQVRRIIEEEERYGNRSQRLGPELWPYDRTVVNEAEWMLSRCLLAHELNPFINQWIRWRGSLTERV